MKQKEKIYINAENIETLANKSYNIIAQLELNPRAVEHLTKTLPADP